MFIFEGLTSISFLFIIVAEHLLSARFHFFLFFFILLETAEIVSSISYRKVLYIEWGGEAS